MAPPPRAREYRLARARLPGRSQRIFFAARAFSRARFPAGFSFSAGRAGRLPVYSHAEAMFSISGKPRPLVFSCTYIPVSYTHLDLDLLFGTKNTDFPYLLLETVAIAFLGTIFGGILAVPFSFLASGNIVPKPCLLYTSRCV